MSTSGNPNKCPICNRFGPGDNRPCRKCEKIVADDKRDGIMPLIKFKKIMQKYAEANPKTYAAALLEVGQKCFSVNDVPREKRNYILGILDRRINLRDGDYAGLTDYANSGYGFREGEFISTGGYGDERSTYGYERK